MVAGLQAAAMHLVEEAAEDAQFEVQCNLLSKALVFCHAALGDDYKEAFNINVTEQSHLYSLLELVAWAFYIIRTHEPVVFDVRKYIAFFDILTKDKLVRLLQSAAQNSYLYTKTLGNRRAPAKNLI